MCLGENLEIGALVAKVKINKSVLWWKPLLVAHWTSTMMKTWQSGVMRNSSIHDILSWSCLSFKLSSFLTSFTHNLHNKLCYPIQSTLWSWSITEENFVLSNLLTWSFSWITSMTPFITPWAYLVISFSLSWVLLWRLFLGGNIHCFILLAYPSPLIH